MSKKLIILQGCPCSGKSTWVAEFLKTNIAQVVSRDTIRYELGKGKYVMDREDEVTALEESRTIEAMEAGLTVINDATNLNKKYLGKWEELAQKYGYEIEYKEFYVPFEEAMKRSKARRDAGGLFIPRHVMLGFYKRYYPEKLKDELTDKRIICQPSNLPNCVICDLDGTLALHQGREPFEWDKIPTDKIDPRLSVGLHILSNHAQIIFVTGRPKSAHEATVKWLSERVGFSYRLLMRDELDFSHGDDYKTKVYHECIEGKYNVLMVFEDSNKCVNAWRNLGLLTCQVANADY